MNTHKQFLFLALIILTTTSLFTAWLDNIPDHIVQPDGTQVDVLLSGDEFHLFAHDSDGYTIVQDEKTGYWCWAVEDGSGDIVSTGVAIHTRSPQSLNLSPRQNISAEKYREKRQWMDTTNAQSPSRTPTSGVVNNLVVFIKFAGDSDFIDPLSHYEGQFNATGVGVNSQYQYFWDASYGQYEVYSHYFPQPEGDLIVSFTSEHPRDYYRPYNAITNPIGYQGGDHGPERTFREHSLLQAAIEAIEDEVPLDLIIDSDDDGYVDNVAFLIRGQPTAWSTLLWPHRWALFSFEVYLHNKRVYDYNFNIEIPYGPEGSFAGGVGTYCHEYAHSMGLPDLYRYYIYGTPVGGWDLMASTSEPPQSISAYMKWKYTDWIDELPEIEIPDVYTLYPNATSQYNHAYRINSPYSETEYFVVEYRRNNTSFIDQNLPGSGLIVYRAIPSQHGNADGLPDEVYTYRPGGTYQNHTTYYDGNTIYAFFNAQVGRTEINDTTNPTSWLSDGSPGGLDISNIGVAGETISFTLGQILDYDLKASSITTDAILYINEPITVTFRVINYGQLEASDYMVRLMAVGEETPLDSLTGVTLAHGEAHDFNLHWTPTTIGATRLYGEIIWEQDENIANNTTTPKNTYTYPPDATWHTLFTDDFEDVDLFWDNWIIVNGNQVNQWWLGIAAHDDFSNAVYISDDFGETHHYDPNAQSITHIYRVLDLPDDANEITLNFDYICVAEAGYDFMKVYLCAGTYTPIAGSNPLGTQLGGLYEMTPQWTNSTLTIPTDLVAGQTALLVFTWLNDTNTGEQPPAAIDNVSITYFGMPTAADDDYTIDRLPQVTLHRNYPNPFNPSTTVAFTVGAYDHSPKQQQVKIDIYNIKGQKVKTLVNKPFPTGTHQIIWNGKDDHDRAVGSGIYFYQLKTEGYSTARKMILIK